LGVLAAGGHFLSRFWTSSRSFFPLKSVPLSEPLDPPVQDREVNHHGDVLGFEVSLIELAKGLTSLGRKELGQTDALLVQLLALLTETSQEGFLLGRLGKGSHHTGNSLIPPEGLATGELGTQLKAQ
jgi:hypothetical protein